MGRNIVVCFDGTGNDYSERNSSVIRLFQAIERGPEQIAYYDPGVGTTAAPGALTRSAKSMTRFFGLAFGYGITKNIEDAYQFLMDEYQEGDRVFLFGFSRGAFTARALAGMLNKCGLLVKGSNNLIPYASKMYKRGKDSIAWGFKATFSRECKPHFVGVWDTVKSVGMLIPRKFPNATLNEDVKFGRHAVAIDEKRSKFRPNLWDEPGFSGQSIKQVWFAGYHSDIAGSHKADGLPNIALRWMLDEAGKQGLLINGAAYDEIKPDHTDRMHNSLFPIWWILGWRHRTIAKGSLIHESVFQRINDVPSYKPRNLPPKEDVTIVS
jgi:uncharacterized protein (DUF2235 family)